LAAIVARYADLFTRPQLEALREAEESADGEERERLYRLRLTCEQGLVEAVVAEDHDALENALLEVRLTFEGEELPLRSADAKLAVLPDFAKREELGALAQELDASFNERRRALLVARNDLEAELSGVPDAVARNQAQKQISLRELEGVLRDVADAAASEFERLRERWFERLLGPERTELPTSAHLRWLRRLSPLESTYPKERSVEVWVETVRGLGFDIEAMPSIRLDLEDRPQKSPRACVIASDAPEIVHLITRAQGGLSHRATMRRCSRRRRASATTRAATCRTWTQASTPPTTCERGSARRSSVRTSAARSARTGGGAPKRASSCAGCSRRARGPRRRRSHAASASIRSTPGRSSPS
jgi:hypothetical protein